MFVFIYDEIWKWEKSNETKKGRQVSDLKTFVSSYVKQGERKVGEKIGQCPKR